MSLFPAYPLAHGFTLTQHCAVSPELKVLNRRQGAYNFGPGQLARLSPYVKNSYCVKQTLAWASFPFKLSHTQ